MISQNLIKIAILSLSILFVWTESFADDASETDVFSNFENPAGDFLNIGNGVEYGDQINFDDNMVVKMLTEFRFETFGQNLDSTDARAVVRFYSASSQTTQSVGELEIQTVPIRIANGFQTHIIKGIDWDVSLADSIIWTATFDGIPEDGQAGLTLSTPPTVGSSLSDFFQNTEPGSSSSFKLMQFTDNDQANFTALVKGETAVVPEPNTLALLSLSWLLIWFRSKSRLTPTH